MIAARRVLLTSGGCVNKPRAALTAAVRHLHRCTSAAASGAGGAGVWYRHSLMNHGMLLSSSSLLSTRRSLWGWSASSPTASPPQPPSSSQSSSFVEDSLATAASVESTNNIIVNGDAVVMAASSSSHPAASAVVDPDLVAETAVAAASPSSDPLFTIASDFSSSDSSLTAITAIGDLKSLGLASNYPPGLFQQAIEYIHVYSGMPWWATIFVSTLLLRVILLRLAIPGQRTAARLIPHQAEFKEAQLDIAAAKRRGDMLEVKTLSEKMFARYKELGVNPLAGLLGVLQLPFFISFYFALGGLSEMSVPGLSTGGTAWFTDLLVADPYYVLPILATVFMYATVFLAPVMSNDKTAATMRRLMLVAPLGSLFITLSFPALINLYFASMAGLTALQMYAFTLPSVKRFFDIPVDDDTNNTGTTTSTTPSVKSVFASLSSASASKIREREMFGKLSLDRSLRELESLRKSVEAVDLVDPTTRSIASSSSSSSHHKNSKSIHKNKKNRN